MPNPKIEETLKQQRDQLSQLKTEREALEARFIQLREAISQLTGSIAALEYVNSLKDDVPTAEKV